MNRTTHRRQDTVLDQQAHEERTAVRRRDGAISPFMVVTLVAAAFLATVGAVALLRAGVDNSLRTPVVQVAGLDHTALLGIVEIAVGAALAFAVLSHLRSLTTVIGAGLLVFGIVLLIEPEAFRNSLATMREHGWWSIAIGAVVLIASIIPTTRIVEERVVVDNGDMT